MAAFLSFENPVLIAAIVSGLFFGRYAIRIVNNGKDDLFGCGHK